MLDSPDGVLQIDQISAQTHLFYMMLWLSRSPPGLRRSTRNSPSPTKNQPNGNAQDVAVERPTPPLVSRQAPDDEEEEDYEEPEPAGRQAKR